MYKIKGTKVPIYVWATDSTDLEDSALVQALDTADNMPIYSHLALMPDAHMGFGMPVGGVMPLVDAICPNAVGVDIGCGMLAVRTNLKGMDIQAQKEIYGLIRESVPVGYKKHTESKHWDGFNHAPTYIPIIKEQLDNARLSLGTLGGGNHFIEFQKGSDGYIWFMIHSGSRNLGKQVCDHFNKLAESEGNSDLKDMAYFDMNTPEAIEYGGAMDFALEFALANRLEMSKQVKLAITEVLGEVGFPEATNIHHNYAAAECFGEQRVIVHRKGATLATLGNVGIIPGSQGTPSYIVEGKGSLDSFNSCSHGAGRVMSRTKATGLNYKGKRKFEPAITVEDATEAMGDLECRFTERNVDEAPQAYKDIREVMKAQEDLVDVLAELDPYQIAAIKG